MFCSNKRLVDAMVKAGFSVEVVKGWQSNESLRESGVKDEADILDTERNPSTFRVVNGEQVVTWHKQGEKAVCVHCTRLNDGRDSMTDYFPGTYAKTIKAAVAHLGKAK